MDIALSTKQEDLATTLIEHKVNVDQTNSEGTPLLHLAIERGWYFVIMRCRNWNVNFGCQGSFSFRKVPFIAFLSR